MYLCMSASRLYVENNCHDVMMLHDVVGSNVQHVWCEPDQDYHSECIILTVRHGSWNLKSADKKRLDSVEMWCYHRILRIPWSDKITNASVLKELGVGQKKPLQANIIARKLSYFGHAIRHHCLEKTIIQGMVDGKRG